MRRAATVVLPLALASWLFAGGCGAGEPNSFPQGAFNVVKAQAIKDMDNDAAFPWATAFIPRLEDALDMQMEHCEPSHWFSRRKPFGLVVRIRADGVLDEAWVDPATDVSRCVVRQLKGAAFDKPPFSPLSLYIETGSIKW